MGGPARPLHDAGNQGGGSLFLRLHQPDVRTRPGGAGNAVPAGGPGSAVRARQPRALDSARLRRLLLLVTLENPRYKTLTIIDSIAWCHGLLPELTISRKMNRVTVHTNCSAVHLGLAKTLEEIAHHLAEDVEMPIGTSCCGTAGDRGLLHPELVRSATREMKAVLGAHPAEV